MPRENISDLLAFLAIAKERSFTKAALLSSAFLSRRSATRSVGSKKGSGFDY